MGNRKQPIYESLRMERTDLTDARKSMPRRPHTAAAGRKQRVAAGPTFEEWLKRKKPARHYTSDYSLTEEAKIQKDQEVEKAYQRWLKRKDEYIKRQVRETRPLGDAEPRPSEEEIKKALKKWHREKQRAIKLKQIEETNENPNIIKEKSVDVNAFDRWLVKKNKAQMKLSKEHLKETRKESQESTEKMDTKQKLNFVLTQLEAQRNTTRTSMKWRRYRSMSAGTRRWKKVKGRYSTGADNLVAQAFASVVALPEREELPSSKMESEIVEFSDDSDTFVFEGEDEDLLSMLL